MTIPEVSVAMNVDNEESFLLAASPEARGLGRKARDREGEAALEVFTSEQRGLVDRAAGEAEKEVGRYYCIPPRGWQHLPYDLLTQEDQGARPLPDPVLAETARVQGLSPARKRPYDFFRIQLNDRSILHAASRERLNGELHSFLVYILTHEMVHLVRLCAILRREDESGLARDVEEARVQRIARQILAGARYPAIGPILAAFTLSTR